MASTCPSLSGEKAKPVLMLYSAPPLQSNPPSATKRHRSNSVDSDDDVGSPTGFVAGGPAPRSSPPAAAAHRGVRGNDIEDDDEEDDRVLDPSTPMSGFHHHSTSLPASSPPPGLSDFDDGILDDDGLVEIEGDEEGLDDEDVDGESLFGDNMHNDYIENRALDAYDADGLDDNSLPSDASDAIARANAAMNVRDRRARRNQEGRRDRRAIFLASEDEENSEDEERLLAQVRVRRNYDEPEFDADDETMPVEQLSDIKADSLAQWIEQPRTSRTIEREFRDFLLTYIDANGKSVYGERIATLGQNNSESLEVSFLHLSDQKAILSYFLANCPAAVLPLFSRVALSVILLYYPNYTRIHPAVHVRITELPTSYTLRDLRQTHLDALVRVAGVVTRRGGVMPQLTYVKFDCSKCGEVLGPFYQDPTKPVRINFCSNCASKGPFHVNSEQTIYRNYQKMTLQESPGSVPAGRLPRHREVILTNDLIDAAKPGEEIEVTGVYKNNFDISLNVKNGFPVFSTVLEANHVNKKEDLFAAFRLSAEDEKEIRKLANESHGRIGQRIIKSIAPSIYGHLDIKTALALSLFGGVAKDINGKHRIRGDINVLLLGDPGTAKSQFLKYVEKTASRAVFATGQVASAVGLTASVRKDPVTREWTLEGGALVLADKGTCMIDEFDKMNDQDRTSIHEAMEQQSISISKAGIVTTLQARCAIVAAANPIRGRYNPTIPFAQNVELTEPILSRFDILCVVRDEADPIADEMLADFVVDNHLRSHPRYDPEHDQLRVTNWTGDVIPQDLLRKYIQYARERCHPQLHQMDEPKISSLYADLRQESLSTGSYPITVRHLESIIRMAEASAKMHLREYVRSEDIDLAIRVTVGSFVSAQKSSIRKQLERGFRKYLRLAKDNEEVLLFLLGQMVKDKLKAHSLRPSRISNQPLMSVEIAIPDFEKRAKGVEVDGASLDNFYKSSTFNVNGYKIVQGNITKHFGN